MKIVIVIIGIISTLLGGLFLHQNWNRTIMLDETGNSLSLDLYLGGLVCPVDISVSEVIIYAFGVGTIFGLILPMLVKLLKAPQYQ